jgi:hypothetical protein
MPNRLLLARSRPAPTARYLGVRHPGWFPSPDVLHGAVEQTDWHLADKRAFTKSLPVRFDDWAAAEGTIRGWGGLPIRGQLGCCEVNAREG